MIRTYAELIRLCTFEERFQYLQLDGQVGRETFGFDRILNQRFYNSQEWKRVRDRIIIRDNGCDLGINGCFITGPIYIHHMNPLTQTDIIDLTSFLLNPEYLICASKRTHDAIHYGCEPQNYNTIVRRPNDTCPWKS